MLSDSILGELAQPLNTALASRTKQHIRERKENEIGFITTLPCINSNLDTIEPIRET